MYTFSFLIFFYFVIKGDCYLNFEVLPQPPIMSNDFNFLYSKIMAPLQRLTESLPDHKVEVQIDINSGNNIPVPKQNIPILKQKRTNKLNFRKPIPRPREIKLREINDVDETKPSTPIPVPTNQLLTQQQQQMLSQYLQQQMMMQQQQLVQQKFLQQQQQQHQQTNPQNIQRQQYLQQHSQQRPQYQQLPNNNKIGRNYLNREGDEIQQPEDEIVEPETPAPPQVPAQPQVPPQAPGQVSAQPQVPSQIDTKPQKLAGEVTRRPVYMEDLQKALDDFEKKFIAKQRENKVQSNFDGSVKKNIEGDLNEATKPLLKKDLWMALGLKYMTGCPHANNNGAFKPTRGPNLFPNANYKQQNVNPAIRVDKIMQLLKRGVKSINDVSKPGDGNIQWLQMKIPKRF